MPHDEGEQICPEHYQALGWKPSGDCSSMRFLGLQLEDAVPDAKTIWVSGKRSGSRS